MSDETYTFDQARARLEDIAKQTKGASLEKCLDLLEEGVKLANVCTEKIDHTRWRDEVEETPEASAPDVADADASAGEPSSDDPDEGASEESADAPETDVVVEDPESEDASVDAEPEE